MMGTSTGAGYTGPAAYPDDDAPGYHVERSGYLLRGGLRLGDVVLRRPEGITANQWNAATRVRLDVLVGDAATGAATFAVELHSPDRSAEEARLDRATDAVAATVGLPLVRIECACPRPVRFARQLAGYVVDARTFAGLGPRQPEPAVGVAAVPGALPLPNPSTIPGAAGPAGGYREIVGRLPDGRTGHVNDLGALARVAAFDAYVERRTADPIIRGLRVSWRGGPAEGWAWLAVRADELLFVRARLWRYRVALGIAADRLAEDLATMAIGAWLGTAREAWPPPSSRRALAAELAQVRDRRDEMDTEFAFDHISFD